MDNKIEDEVMREIEKCINDKQNFLLSGGAGSGKTYTLVKTIEYIREKHPLSGIACITFTEAATNEIKSRLFSENLLVSTIHNFLWSMIKNYQKPLRETILALIEQENNKEKTGIKFNGKIKEEDGTENTIDFEELKTRWANKPPKIEYENYTRIYKGIFSHDDLLKIAEYMFSKYPLLCKITCDKFKYILVDEYQDTSPKVIHILLESISKLEDNHKACIGFYGDKMQAIYDDNRNGKGVGDIDKYLTNNGGCVKEILKKDNYRCSREVIKLINNIRNDNIKQEPTHRDKNGNIDNKQGNIKFLYSNTEIDYDKLIEHRAFQNWNFSNSLETKVLFLTHRVVSKHSKFYEILDSYKEPSVDENGEIEIYKRDSGENKKGDIKLKDRKDRLVKEEYLDTLAKHLLKIGEILYDFENKNYNSIICIIKNNGGKINSHQDKLNIHNILSEFIKENNEKTIGNAIEAFNENKILIYDDNLDIYKTQKADIYNQVKKISIEQVKHYYEYFNKLTPFSTQHSIKGAEFDNVLVILDNGGWNQYNWKLYFEGEGKESVIDRTRKLFYVCCSRSKDNLVVFVNNPSSEYITRAKELFGENNIECITKNAE